MSKRARRSLSGEQKLAILREHLVEGNAVSEVCERHQIQPVLTWNGSVEVAHSSNSRYHRRRQSWRTPLDRPATRRSRHVSAALLAAAAVLVVCAGLNEASQIRDSPAAPVPSPGGEIFIQIFGATDDGSGHVQVVAGRMGTSDGSHQYASPEPDGRFRLTGLEPGQWTVLAIDRATGRNVVGAVEVAAGGGPYRLDLVLGGVASLTGSVRVNGEPLAGAMIILLASDGTVHGAGVETASDGTFRATGLVPGSYTLSFAEGLTVLARRRLVLAEDDELHLDLAVASLSGQVLDAAGESVPRAHVQVLIPGRSGADGLGGSATTDAAGRFHFPHLLPNRYTVTAHVEGNSVTSATVLLEAGDRRELELR